MVMSGKRNKMKFNVVTLFTEGFDSFLSSALLGKAVEQKLVDIQFSDPRDFTDDKHRSVDDSPFGGGDGMVLKPEPFVDAIESIDKKYQSDAKRPLRVLMCPQGKPLSQNHLERFAEHGNITLVCGRYEGFDERIRHFVDEEVSLGDFVLNGGEVAAMAIIDGVTRLIPGAIGNPKSIESESHQEGLLEYPHYTRPRTYRDLEVPEVLLSGNHKEIDNWRRLQMLLRTQRRRKDLWRAYQLDESEKKLLEQDPSAEFVEDNHLKDLVSRTYIALLHHPVFDRKQRIVTTALTNLDLHDIARSSRTYGLAGYFIVTPLESQQSLAERIIAHWKEGHGANVHEKRKEALSLVEVQPDLEATIRRIETLHGERPLTIATSARNSSRQIDSGDLFSLTEKKRPLLILLGTGWGLAGEILDSADVHLAPIRGLSSYNHLSVRSAAAIILDRCFGMRD